MNIKYGNDEIIETYEIDEKNEENVNLQKIDTGTMKPTESSSKRKLNIKNIPEKVRCIKFLSYFCSIFNILNSM